jgi:hypothetical protein
MDAGLCATCRHARTVDGARSQFWLCERSRTDATFPRYPRLPVLRCRGYEPAQTPTPRDRKPPSTGSTTPVT